MSKTWLSGITLAMLSAITPVMLVYAIKQPQQSPISPTLQRAQTLGWVKQANINLCQGHYQEPNLLLSPNSEQPLTTDKIQITGHGPAVFSQNGTSTLDNVTISEPGRRISADKAILIRDPHTHKINLVKLSGHIRIRIPGKLLTGNKGHYYLSSKKARIENALYHIAFSPVKTNKKQKLVTLEGRTAWGHAAWIKQLKPGLIDLHHVTYTTCNPLSSTWHVKASELHLNRQSGRGTAHNAWIIWQGIPVFYTPYLSFPIDNRRKSGFLLPQFNFSSHSGFNLDLPFYLNLMPNLDLTLTPNIYSKRGVLWQGLSNYLLPHSRGTLNLGLLPHDREFASFKKTIGTQYPSASSNALNRVRNFNDNRYFISWHQTSHFGEHLSTQLDYNRVSDDYFFQDFDNNLLANSFNNQLLRQAYARYQTQHWSLDTLVQKYQTLHPINLTTFYDQYARLPQVDFHANYPQQAFGLDYNLDAQAVRFRHQNEMNVLDPFSNRPFAQGSRFNLQPTISLPISSLSGYITPKLSLQLTHYDLTQSLAWPNHQINRSTPIFDVDSGLVFERNLHLFNNGYTQTLEPRLFYLYVPYRNQNNIPVFDSLLQTFTYDQMFRDNRFSGIDRIGDANQVSYGLTSRLLDANTGSERVRLSIGQIHYFHNRRVTLCSTASCILQENPNFQQSSSPIATNELLNLNNQWSISHDFAWNPHTHQVDNSTVNITYHRDKRHIIYINFSYLQSSELMLNQSLVTSTTRETNLGTTWGLTPHWSVLGILSREKIKDYDNAQSFYYGLQYNTCCWAARFVTGRNFTGWDQNRTSQYDKRIFFQIMLKGLGNAGTNGVGDLLKSDIPDYDDIFAKHRIV